MLYYFFLGQSSNVHCSYRPFFLRHTCCNTQQCNDYDQARADSRIPGCNAYQWRHTLSYLEHFEKKLINHMSLIDYCLKTVFVLLDLSRPNRKYDVFQWFYITILMILVPIYLTMCHYWVYVCDVSFVPKYLLFYTMYLN